MSAINSTPTVSIGSLPNCDYIQWWIEIALHLNHSSSRRYKSFYLPLAFPSLSFTLLGYFLLKGSKWRNLISFVPWPLCYVRWVWQAPPRYLQASTLRQNRAPLSQTRLETVTFLPATSTKVYVCWRAENGNSLTGQAARMIGCVAITSKFFI